MVGTLMAKITTVSYIQVHVCKLYMYTSSHIMLKIVGGVSFKILPVTCSQNMVRSSLSCISGEGAFNRRLSKVSAKMSELATVVMEPVWVY